MKHLMLTLLMVAVFHASVSIANPNDGKEIYNWKVLVSAFKDYSNDPTDINARKVLLLLPSSHITYTGSDEEKEALEYISSWSQLGMLERQVISGDRESIRLAYKLKSIADGAFSEDLNVMLGQVIRIKPKLFLEGLSEFKGLVVGYDALVGNYGDVYVDRQKAQCLEDKLREQSLLGVDSSELIQLRDRCVKFLRESISEDCADV